MSSEQDLGEPSSQQAELSDDGQMFAAEYKDGQLQIVEVSPYDKVADSQSTSEFPHGAILPDLSPSDEQTKYLQINEYDGKGFMQLNLLNFALVKSTDGSSSYQLVSSGDGAGQAIACLLSDGDEDDPQEPSESYVMLESEEGESVDPCIYLQASTCQENSILHTETPATPRDAPPEKTTQTHQTAPPPLIEIKRKLTPVEILEKAKALQKAKARAPAAACKKRGRRKGGLPSPLELLATPGFKLYLYSCKQCSFKCNAVKEMSAHKKAEHSTHTLQCARCPYRTTSYSQLAKHTRDAHTDKTATITMTDGEFQSLELDESVMACDVLVCGACGFESNTRSDFLAHIAQQHADISSV